MDFPMKTGFSNVEASNEPDGPLLDFLNKLLLVFAEKSVILAVHYAKIAGRDNLSGQDTIYALQYLCHEFMDMDDLDRQVGMDSSDTDSDSDSDSDSFTENENDCFSRANSEDDPICAKMNQYHDEWDSWDPTDDIQVLLKRNVDKAMLQV